MDGSNPSALRSIVRQLCPRCRAATIFRGSVYWGFPKMHARCPSCGLLFNREPGYFLGAMYISYGLGIAVICAFGAVFRAVTRWSWTRIGVWAIVLFLPFVPMVTYLARVLWIYLDQTFDPDRS